MKDIKEYLEYDPDTGIVSWIKKPFKANRIKIGDEAGNIHKSSGYRKIIFCGIDKPTTHWIWMLVHGRFPLKNMEIDHINRDKLDNRLSNLREVSSSINSQNMKNNRKDLFVYPVKYKCKDGIQRYQVKMQMENGGPVVHIGVYKDYDKAVAASQEAQIRRSMNGFK